MPEDPIEIHRLAVDLDREPSPVDLALLDDRERACVTRLRRRPDRARAVTGRAALRRLLAVRLGVDPCTVRLTTGCWGKPRLDGEGPEFNLSHAGAWVHLAIGGRRGLGIDIESLAAIGAAESVAPAVLSPGELAAWAGLDGARRQHLLARLWTSKEAVAKSIGLGLGADLRSLQLLGQDGGMVRQVVWDGVLPIALTGIPAAPGYVAALAVAGTHDLPALRFC